MLQRFVNIQCTPRVTVQAKYILRKIIYFKENVYQTCYLQITLRLYHFAQASFKHAKQILIKNKNLNTLCY